MALFTKREKGAVSLPIPKTDANEIALAVRQVWLSLMLVKRLLEKDNELQKRLAIVLGKHGPEIAQMKFDGALKTLLEDSYFSQIVKRVLGEG